MRRLGLAQIVFALTIASCTCDPGFPDARFACVSDEQCAQQRCVAGVCGGVPALDAGSDAGAGAPDAGAVDAGATDAGEPDAGAGDAGATDAGAPDAGAIDAGPADAGSSSDSGVADAGCLGSISINAGGLQTGSFQSDALFVGGDIYTGSTVVGLGTVANPAPVEVYESERYGAFNYVFPGLTPGGSYLLRLHFAEIYWTDAGERSFDVQINGVGVLSAFDILATAGGPFLATVKEFPVTADAQGQLEVDFILGAADYPKVSGLELQCPP